MIKILWESLTTKYFQFFGRASRKEYWILYLLGVFFCQGISLVSLYYYNLFIKNIYLFFLILFLVLFLALFFIAVSVRRLHDFNFSGWWFLIITLFDIWTNDFFNDSTGGFIITNIPHFIIGIIKGTSGTNKYGEEPKY